MAADSTLQVGPALVDCVGVAPQKCMLVRRGTEQDWSLFYDGIDGFAYQPGFLFTLRVEVREVKNPPADASSVNYRLVREISREAVSPG